MRIKESQPADAIVLRERPLARYVVEGVITRSDGGYQVEARLLDSQKRESLWGDRFRLTETAVSNVATGAHRIAHGVHHEVLETETRRITVSPPRRPDSMDLVLMGNTAKKKGTSGADAARRLFEMALNLDEAHVPALLALSSVSEDGEIDRLTQKAISTDPLCADAWVLRSEILWRLGQTDAAREAVTRALRINQANLRAIAELNRQLMNDGHWDRVIRSLEEIEFEFGKSGALNRMLGIQCRARLLAGQDASQACDRSFAVSGSRASLVYATAAAARNGNEESALRAGARLKARHSELTIAAFRNEINSSKQYSSHYREQMEAVVYPALERSGIPKG